MSSELSHIVDFLRPYPPFSSVPEHDLHQVASQLEVVYYRQGKTLAHSSGIAIIRSGAAELRNRQRQLLDKCAEGNCFDLSALNRDTPGIHANFIEDSLVYLLPQPACDSLRSTHRDFDRFFQTLRSRRLRRAARHSQKPHDMMREVAHVMSRHLQWVEPSTPIRDCAKKMTEQRVSSLLIMHNHTLLGILTDRDLRSRVIAEDCNTDKAVSHVMTPEPITLQSHQSIFDATLTMTKHNTHHLPVLQGSEVVGMLTTSDLTLAKQDDPIFLVQHIQRETSVEAIAKICASLPNLFAQWIVSGIRAHQLSHVLTAVSDAVCQRLIERCIEDMGAPPVPFAWLSFGSQGRKEQMLNSDQDNALLISDRATATDLRWFRSLAERVCSGLNRCGYRFCPGDIMAQNPKWRMNLKQWQHTVSSWARSPTPKAVMHVSIFFDIRSVYGDATLCEKLQQHMLNTAQNNTIFLAALAHNIAASPPPLGIFRRFVVERDGEHRNELDLKKRAILPLVETVRLHALAKGLTAINTFDRLRDLKQGRHISVSDMRNLEDALRLVMQLRCQHQAEQLLAGEVPNNYIPPKALSELARRQLKDAFEVIEDSRGGIVRNYRGGLS